MNEKITTSADDPRLKPMDPVVKKMLQHRHGILVGDPILPEEFERRVDDVLNGKIEMLRGVLAVSEDEIRFEEFAMVVPKDADGVEGTPELGCLFLAEADGEQHCYYEANSVWPADQRFDYVPHPDWVEAGEWNDRWDAQKNKWRTD